MKKKAKPKYALGGLFGGSGEDDNFFKKLLPNWKGKVFDYARDGALLGVDGMLSGVGLKDTIGKSDYSTSEFKKLDKPVGKVAPIAGQAIASYFLGPAGGAAAGAVNSIGSGINKDPAAAVYANQQLQAQQDEALRRQRASQPGPMMSTGVASSGFYAMGGRPLPTYEVEKGEVVQGSNVSLEAGNQLASDVHKVGGNSHANGGTEGVGGERVYSDRIGPDKKNTYADLATKLGKVKGRLEEGTSLFSKNTYNRMGSRIDRQLDELFDHQESTKPITTQSTFAKGGPIPEWYQSWADKAPYSGYPVPTGSKRAGWQTRLRDNNLYAGPIDGDFGRNSKMGYMQYRAGVQPIDSRPAGGGLAPLPTTLSTLPQSGDAPAASAPGVEGNMFDFGSAARGLSGSSDKLKGIGAGIGKFGAAAAPYIDNLTNAFIEPVRPMNPMLTSAPQLNTNVDINPELAELQRSGRVVNQAIDASTANSSVARANKVSAYAASLGEVGRLYGAKRNGETALMNQQALLNGQTNSTNTGLLNNYRDKLTATESERRSMISANAANAAMDLQGQLRDSRLERNDLERFKLINQQYRASGVVDRNLLNNLLSLHDNDKKRAAKAANMTDAEFEDALAKSK